MKDKTQAGDRRAREPCFLPYHEQQRVVRPQSAGRRKTWMLHPEGWTPNAGKGGPAPRGRRAPLKTVKNKTKTTRHGCRLCWRQWCHLPYGGPNTTGLPLVSSLGGKSTWRTTPPLRSTSHAPGHERPQPQFCPCQRFG